MTITVQASNTTVVVNEEQASVSVSQEANAITITANASPSIETIASPAVELEFFGEGPQGVPGPGIIPSGTTGQVLAKISNANYDTEWKTMNISDLNDVDVTNKTDGSVLVYNGNSHKFIADSSFTALSLTDGGNY